MLSLFSEFQIAYTQYSGVCILWVMTSQWMLPGTQGLGGGGGGGGGVCVCVCVCLCVCVCGGGGDKDGLDLFVCFAASEKTSTDASPDFERIPDMATNTI